VLSTAGPTPELTSRRSSSGGGGGPVIEYVRGPMRIAMAPVASANPNDAGVARPRRGKKQRRWERGGGFRADGGRPDRSDGRGGPGPRPDGPRPDGPRPAQPWQAQGEGGNGAPGERRRRRRRRRRRLDSMAPGGQPGFQPGGNGAPPSSDAPVSFFAPVGGGSGPIQLGPDGLPMRKRRRRRRRGRGGRQREWRAQGGGGEGGDGGGGGPPPGGSVSDNGDGNA
jgi:translation initiation factor IF-2